MAAPTPDLLDFSAIPLFPLPNVVLFPCAVLPLHIFEDRYRDMTAAALRGDRQIAMALLKPGWEKDYHRHPEIEPIVCVGTILTHELLPDGKYNFLLQGHTRARVVEEHGDRSYRLSHLKPLEQKPVSEAKLAEDRHRLISVFDNGSLLATVIGRQFRQLLSSSLSTADIADLIAFNFLDDIPLKQSLLSDGDVLRRVKRTISAFETTRAVPPSVGFHSSKPSLN
ncbi:MAG TPA: LON peptidase substrate-binding domain-containing protein [Tepidisphaeraceae bacterium]|jgi:Lon protease-like protein|nr:LON peptidase substrate-binding domain-containing protein [Tepidisphaeraceae bacterium]